MSIPKLTTGKFYCYALRARASPNLARTLELDDGLYVSSAPPFLLDDWWREQIGAIESRHIVEESDLFILALSEDPAVDERSLERRLAARYFSLVLQGVGYAPPAFRQGSVLLGDNTSRGMTVRGLGSLDKFHQPPKVTPGDVEEGHLKTAARLARGIDALFPRGDWGEHFLRLRKGFSAYLDGVRHAHAHNRLHQFVRALDAVVKPRAGDATRKFRHRCQFFAGRNADDVKLLGELYELRSAAEHLNPLGDKLGDYPEHERDNVKALRTYQAELLASFAYRKILSNPAILSCFETDQSIDDLWATDASALISFWGDTIDLHKSPAGFFQDFL
jgi:hypothetical protein